MRGPGYTTPMALGALLTLASTFAAFAAFADEKKPAASLEIRPGDHVVFIGNTFADNLRRHGYFETLLHARYPEHRLVVRNTAAKQLRPHAFGDIHTHLRRQKADVVFLALGMGESFRGAAGLQAFRDETTRFVRTLKTNRYNGSTTPRIALIGPIAHEALGGGYPDGREHCRELASYNRVLREIAAREGVFFIDVFTPTLERMRNNKDEKLTSNGIHLTASGYLWVSQVMGRAIGILPADSKPLPRLPRPLEAARGEIVEKNRLFFSGWRAPNGEYIYGRRKNSWHFDAEFDRIEKLTADADRKVWAKAREASSLP